MGETLRSNLESFEYNQGYDSEVTDLAVNGLSRVVDKQDNTTNYDRNYTEENDYDDDDYYGEYEEQYYAGERIDFDEEKLTLQEKSA